MEQLKTVSLYARESFRGPNRGQSLVNVIHKTVGVCVGTPFPAERAFEVLLKVMIGESLTKRGTGIWFVGNKFGATGFQADLRDKSDQCAHAIAAMYIGFSPSFPYAFEQIIALLTEFGILTGTAPEYQDTRLYSIGASIGRRVTNGNLPQFPRIVAEAICDQTVRVPS